ncbi:MAG: type II secretion system inner membrane protein GspF [Candidatus Desulfatibia sp.]|uniref:type II secretion system inner membrane protein GspF n=1 Tax=Candidatus Desulfatibia sp. TaxID=3101189 RepID=UPI002F33F228
MPVYEYKALTQKGKTTSGIIDAESPIIARQKIRALKTFPVAVKEVHDSPTKKESRTLSFARHFQRVTPSEVAMLTRQLATLISAGFPLVPAIDILISQTRSNAFKRQLAKIKDSIVEGNSFARSLSLYPRSFSELYVNMVHAGESSGTLEIVLERLADITEGQQALKQRIRSALAYPVLMTFIGTVVLFLLLTFIVPSITSIFTDMGQALPAPTIFLINTSAFFKKYWWLILALGAAMLIALRSIVNTSKGRYLLDKSMLLLPGSGLLVKKLAVARFARTLGSLLENGVSMLTALEIVKNIVGNQLIANVIEDAAKEVEKGQDLGTALAESKIFPDISIQMIIVGEQSGRLESMLNKIADVFEGEVESSVMSMTSLIEPLMILIMGIAVGFIVLSICLPIFEMNQLVM